jgi:flagellar FliJ protein
MRKKIFGLEKVLDFRNEMEKLRKAEFAAARNEFEQAHKLLRSEEERIDRLGMEFMDRQIEGISAMELLMYSDFFRKKDSDIKAQRQAVTALDQTVTEKREILVDASRDKKVLEELKKKKFKAFDKEMDDKERAFLDELALRKGGNSAG